MVELGPYWQIVRAQARSQVQYRASFLLDLIGSVLLTGMDVVSVFVLFRVTHSLGGFGIRQVVLMTALSTFAFACADLGFGNADRLRELVRTGGFDAVLLRPLSVLGQLLAGVFALRRIGRAVQGAAFYVVALAFAGIHWTPGRIALACYAPLAGLAFFAGVFVAGATVVFWWIESGELANSLTYGGRDFTAYPSTVYGQMFRKVFAFGLGFGFVAYLPVLALTGLADPLGTPGWFGWCSPAVALIAMLVAGALWRTGVRHYRSTGS